MKPLLPLMVLAFSANSTFAQLSTIPTRPFSPQSVSTGNPVKTHGTLKIDGDMIWQDDLSVPANWTVNTIAGTFVLGDNSTPEISANNPYLGTMTSTTATNGFASFNGSQYINANDFSVKHTTLTSATIDLTSFSFIDISFEQHFRRYGNEQTFVEISEDGGATWVLVDSVNTTVPVGAEIQNTSTIHFPGNGSANTLIRFHWLGSGYGWSIDDVHIYEGYASDVTLNNAFVRYSDQLLGISKIPVNALNQTFNQFSFISFLKNTGYYSTDFQLHVQSGSYDYTTNAIQVASLQDDSIEVDPQLGMIIPAIPGMVTFTETLESPSAVLQQNNNDSKTLEVEITDHIYAVDAYDGTPQSMDEGVFLNWPDSAGEQAIGSLFAIHNTYHLDSVQIGIANVPVQDQANYIGNTFRGRIFIFNSASGEFEYYTETQPKVLTANDFGKVISLPILNNWSTQFGDLLLVTADRDANQPVPFALAGTTYRNTVFGLENGTIVRMQENPYTPKETVAPLVRLHVSPPCEVFDTLTFNTFQLPSDDSICNGFLKAYIDAIPTYHISIDGAPAIQTNNNHPLLDSLCPGIHSIEISDNCGLTSSQNFVITTDSNYIFNNPFIDSIALDSVGYINENCEIYYNGIDTAFIDSIWANGNQVNVIWNVVSFLGSGYDTSSYTLNNGNGVYWLQLSVFCPFRDVSDYFSVTQAIYFEDGTISTAGVEEKEHLSFNLFPNPTNNEVTIQTDGSDELQLQVTDTQGKMVLEEAFTQQKTISLEAFRSGMYLFRLQSGKGTAVARVIKN